MRSSAPAEIHSLFLGLLTDKVAFQKVDRKDRGWGAWQPVHTVGVTPRANQGRPYRGLWTVLWYQDFLSVTDLISVTVTNLSRVHEGLPLQCICSWPSWSTTNIAGKVALPTNSHFSICRDCLLFECPIHFLSHTYQTKQKQNKQKCSRRNWAWRCMPVIPALGRLEVEGGIRNSNLYVASARSVRTT